jgi:asparagine synthase (glutamine-hydrolysing)
MSGFFGIIRTDGVGVDQALLDRIGRALEFRGSDGTSTWKSANAGFVFTFLNTGTPHQSHTQPIPLDGRYWLAGEVRLDARRELVAELCEKGQPAGAETPDGELLLQCWKVWGQGSLRKILGDFSFGLWDAASESLYCARDFAGARPLYYAQGPGVFCLSNTLRALRLVPEIFGDLDDLFVCDFLLQGLSSDPERTVWRAARRLLPGHRLCFSKGKLEVQRFLQLPIEEPLRLKKPEEFLEGFRDLLGRAVADRMPQGKLAFYLSGGLDSASVCAMASRAARERAPSGEWKAFTVSWRPLLDDPEPDFAALTAQFLGLQHEILQEEFILPDDESGTIFTPEPNPELFFGRSCRLYRAIAAHSRVVLAGDGGDNVLEGQAWQYLKYLWHLGEWKEIAQSFAAYTAAHGRLPALRGGFRTRLQAWFEGAAKSPEGLPAWLNPEFSRRVEKEYGEKTERADAFPPHPVHPQAYRGLHSGFWGNVLEEEDAGWTRIQLESRAPFLDVRLLRFLLRLPPVPWCMHKELTRQAMRGLLPVEILERKKTPLVEEPLQVCQQKYRWQPQVMKNPPKRLEEFVEWRPWLATLENSKGLLSWENLCPLALAYWLKAIENERGIK